MRGITVTLLTTCVFYTPALWMLNLYECIFGLILLVNMLFISAYVIFCLFMGVSKVWNLIKDCTVVRKTTYFCLKVFKLPRFSRMFYENITYKEMHELK